MLEDDLVPMLKRLETRLERGHAVLAALSAIHCQAGSHGLAVACSAAADGSGGSFWELAGVKLDRQVATRASDHVRLAVAAARAKLLMLQGRQGRPPLNMRNCSTPKEWRSDESSGASEANPFPVDNDAESLPLSLSPPPLIEELSAIVDEVRSVVPGTVKRRNSVADLFGENASDKRTAIAEQRVRHHVIN